MDLFSDIRFIKGVGEERAKLFHNLGIETVYDMLYFFPVDYEDRTKSVNIADVNDGDTVCIRAFADCAPREHRIRKGFFLYKFFVSDETGRMEITLFNQKFAAQCIEENAEYVFYGKVTRGRFGFTMASPEFERVDKSGVMTAAIVPKYRLTANLSRKVCLKIIKNCIEAVGTVPDILPLSFRAEHKLCEINYALRQIHFPDSEAALKIAHRRLVFEELYIMSLALACLKQNRERDCGNAFSFSEPSEFIASLPFLPTNAQIRVIGEIAADLSKERVMNRLVQGDVGSGKTAVAAAACFMAKKSGFQTALMAPTEILARQHLESFSSFLPGFNIVLLVGKMTKKQKEAAVEKIKNGEADVIIGTHALIEDGAEYKNLGLVITDEQHRFGVRQRAALSEKGDSPHMLIMTATPIPRTLALTLYGDLDVSVIDELPPGRQQIKTYAMGEGMRTRVYDFLKKQLDEGGQGYIICSLVDPSDKIEAAAAVEFMERVAENELKDYSIGLLHGKIKDKDAVMNDFAEGRLQVLISTTVVEVGVNVPNATVMIIENAERFGLSQLHQLRGRVGRGKRQSYCIMFPHGKNEITVERMKIMCRTNDGFEISAKDMELRGPGEFFGTRQHGLPELRIANLFTDMNVLSETQTAAEKTLSDDPYLLKEDNKYLKEYMERFLRKTYN